MNNLIIYSFDCGKNTIRWGIRWNGRGIITNKMESALRRFPSFATKAEAEIWVQELCS